MERPKKFSWKRILRAALWAIRRSSWAVLNISGPIGHRLYLYRRRVLWAAGIVAVLAILISLYGGYRYGWKWTGIVEGGSFPKRTLWDWLHLLIIPAVLASGTIWFTWHQQRRDQAIAKQRAQEEALQAYLDHMSELLVKKEQPLHSARQGDSVSTVARARTLTVLPTLDSNRKRSVLQFLYESKLITKGRRVLDLNGADLSGAFLSGRLRWKGDLSLLQRGLIVPISSITLTHADLRGVVLSGATLRGANLQGTDLRGADLSKAELDQANLLDVDLRGAGLRKATLWSANLSRADLTDAVVNDEQLRQAWPFDGATMPNGVRYEDWLKDKARHGKRLTESERDIVDRLEKDYSDKVERAIRDMPNGVKYEDWLNDWKNAYKAMPNGVKYEDWYEDWLKSKGIGEEDVESSGPS